MSDAAFIALYGALCFNAFVGIIQLLTIYKIYRTVKASRPHFKHLDQAKTAAQIERSNYNSLVSRMADLQNKTFASTARYKETKSED